MPHNVSYLHVLSGPTWPRTLQSEHTNALPARKPKFTLTFHLRHLSFPFPSAVFPTSMWTS
jgi:hypothetical protein